MLIIRLGRQGIYKDEHPARCSGLKPHVRQKESPLPRRAVHVQVIERKGSLPHGVLVELNTESS